MRALARLYVSHLTENTFFLLSCANTKGFTRRIVGIPKAESDTILTFLFRQIAENPDFQVRLKWEKNTVAIWDNRVSTASSTL